MVRRFSRSVLAAAILLTLPVLSSAHHSFAMFDPNRAVSLRGVVKEFRWTNPHVFIQLLATAEGGAQEEWSIEMTSPEHLARAGWKPGTLKTGDKVTIVVHPLRDGNKGAQFVSATNAEGAPIGEPPRVARDAGGAAK